MTTLLEISTVPGLKRLYCVAIATALVSGLFCALFVSILICNYHFHSTVRLEPIPLTATTGTGVPAFSSAPSYRQPASDPFNLLPTDHKVFQALKRQLAADRQNTNLQGQVRELDRRLRLDYFRRREIIARMMPLLIIASIVFLFAAQIALVVRRKIPVPQSDATERTKSEDTWRIRLGLITIFAVSMLLVGIALGFLIAPSASFEKVLHAKLLQESDAEDGRQETGAGRREAGGERLEAGGGRQETGSQLDTPAVDRDTMFVALEKNWPSFRGFDCTGIGRSAKTPIHWNARTGENVRWKTEIPLPGKSSPVLWKDERGGCLFLSGADEEKRQVYCFDTDTGHLLWSVDAPSTPESVLPFETSEDTGRAAPTMVLDGQRAFALFGNGDLVATDFQGNILWSKSLGIPKSAYGFSASPALYFDRLIVQYDVGEGSGEGSEGLSKLYAFDVKTGDPVWETVREMPNSWSSPMVCKIAGRFQIITCGDPFVISYDPEDGKEIWRCRCLSNDVGPSPAAWDTMVFVTNQGPRTSAIDASGTGDVTETHVVWRGNNALPDTPSPIATKDRVYTMDSYGYLTAYDPTEINQSNRRALFWELELDTQASFYSSPLLVGNLMYAFDKTPLEEGAGPRAFVVDISLAETGEAGELKDGTAEKMILAVNPMAEPCVSCPAVLDGKLYIRGDRSVFCIGRQ